MKIILTYTVTKSGTKNPVTTSKTILPADLAKLLTVYPQNQYQLKLNNLMANYQGQSYDLISNSDNLLNTTLTQATIDKCHQIQQIFTKYSFIGLNNYICRYLPSLYWEIHAFDTKQDIINLFGNRPINKHQFDEINLTDDYLLFDPIKGLVKSVSQTELDNYFKSELKNLVATYLLITQTEK